MCQPHLPTPAVAGMRAHQVSAGAAGHAFLSGAGERVCRRSRRRRWHMGASVRATGLAVASGQATMRERWRLGHAPAACCRYVAPPRHLLLLLCHAVLPLTVTSLSLQRPNPPPPPPLPSTPPSSRSPSTAHHQTRFVVRWVRGCTMRPLHHSTTSIRAGNSIPRPHRSS